MDAVKYLKEKVRMMNSIGRIKGVELKPCPFCGKKHTAEIVNCVELEDCENFMSCNDEPYKTVVCNVNKGGCGACGGYYPNKSKAIEAWNRREGEQE